MEKYLSSAMSFEEFRGWIDRLVEIGDTAGPDKSESRINYTKISRPRMARLDTTIMLGNGPEHTVREIQ